MNIPELQNLLGARLDDPVSDAPTSRREALRKTGKLGAALALAALPAVALPKTSFAQDGTPTTEEIIAILNYALTLEYLEQFFYQIGTDSGVIPEPDALAIFELIEKHEEDHVEFLTTVITDIGGDPRVFSADDFDYTAGGLLNPFGDYSDFLLLSMGFEDTGVRAYKGQAPYLFGTPYLTQALQIHGVEARHAAVVRRLRRLQGVQVFPWIILDDSDAYPAAFAPIYGGASAPSGYPLDQFPPEENTVQAGIDVTTLPSADGGTFTAVEASSSFDEPLGMDAVLGIADPFIVGQPA